jgi:flagellar hook-associated protein 1 FlgK
MPDVFNVGVSGLNASQIALATVSHNISNANTTGYTRQVIRQEAMLPQHEGYGFVGMGVDVNQVKRNYDKYLTDQVHSAQATSSFNSAQLTQLTQIDNIMANTTVGLNPSLQSFFTGLQTLTQDPGSVPNRQNVISGAQALASQFQSIDTRLTQIQDGTNTQITSAVGSINTLASKIADLNYQINGLAAGSQVNVPNDLMDQRDQAVLDLNKLVQATYSVQADGSYNVFIGNGQTLVQGDVTMPLATRPNPTDPANVQLIQPNADGSTTLLPDKLITGGALGGLLNFRDNTLLQTQKTLGNIAIDFTTAMNYQQSLGLDLNGNAGTPIFTDLTQYTSKPQDAVANLQVLLSDPRTIAAASNMTAGSMSPANSGVVVTSVSATLPGSYGWTSPTTPPLASNHPSMGFSNMVITATSASNITASISGGPGAGTYNVVADADRQNGYKLVSTGTPAKDVGVAFSLSSQMQAGMSFTITPNTAAAMGNGDNTNLLQMVNLQTKPVVDSTRNGTATGLQSFENAYVTATSVVGNATNSVKMSSSAADTTLHQTELAKSNVSGVNLDQEAADLIRYQQAYQASSKVIAMAQSIFQQILQMS